MENLKNDATNNVTPFKSVTEDQIGKFNQNVTARILKHKEEIPSDVFQKILGDKTLIDEIHTSIRKRVEAISNMIVRTVRVNRNQSPQEMLDATGRKQYTYSEVVKSIPRGEGEEVEVFFFKVDRQINDNDLEKEYELRGLKPADPYSLAKVNEDDPAFAGTHPNATHWKNAQGKWYFADFFRWDDDERSVSVNRYGYDWNGTWWFAGLRK